MPSKYAVRGQEHLASTLLSMEELQLLLCWVTPILTQQVSILQENESYNKSDHNQEQCAASRAHVLDDTPADNVSGPKSTMQFDLQTMRYVMEEPPAILNKAIQQNIQLCEQNAKQIEAN